MRGKRTSFSDADCPIARALNVIGDWWSLLIVRECFLGLSRFSELQRSLGLAKNILASRLKKLLAEGILEIRSESSSSVRNRYVLTSKGEQLYVVLIALWQWGESSCFEPGEIGAKVIDNDSGAPLGVMKPPARDGRPLGPKDFTVLPGPARPRSRAVRGSARRAAVT